MNTKSKKSSKSNARNKAARKVVKHVKAQPVKWSIERKVAPRIVETTTQFFCKPGEPKDARRLAVRMNLVSNDIQFVVYRGKKAVERTTSHKQAVKTFKKVCKAR